MASSLGFRHDHLAGPHHAIVQLVSVLGDHQHGVGRILVGRLLHDGVVEVRIERRVQGLDAVAVMALEHVLQLLAAPS